MKRTHLLKLDNALFVEVAQGVKQFEIRLNDRHFQAGDYLRLLRWDPDEKGYMVQNGTHVTADSADAVSARVSFVMYGGQYGLKEGYVAMSLELEKVKYDGRWYKPGGKALPLDTGLEPVKGEKPPAASVP